jgi:2-amino-4-hydroxy-6-hydroxymethyldihydropteridine diphosphokinase
VGVKTAYISLGSNLGDRILALEAAVEKLKALPDTRYIVLSGLYETSPVGMEGGPFLNAVAVIETGLEPGILLRALLSTEKTIGRARKPGKAVSRLIDLDLLLYGNTTVEEENLILPHPRMLHRRFVMEPLAELAPDLRVPPTGITVSATAANLAKNHPEQEVRRLGTLEEVKANYGLRIED